MMMMRRRALLSFAWLLWCLVLILPACEEHRPALLERPPASSTPDPPIGLDTRPISATCTANAKPAHSNALIGFQRVTTAPLKNPVELLASAMPNNRALYVLEQKGRVLRLNDDGATTSLVLDLTAKVECCGEAGLLGIAFAPRFADNGFVFLYHTAPYPNGTPPKGAFRSLLVRYHSNDGGLTLDPSSEKIIITVDQPYSNHNGGTIAFGADGFLYWGLGDGGSGGDPDGNGQKKTTLLGKMVRIDVDGGDPYAIPPTNPFASGTGGARPEIYALGLRNPYRWRFDPITNALWVGDVGQGAREEIDKVVLGGNYGWNIREGKTCFSAPTCESAGLIDPIVDHDRNDATTITGGVVYRGTGVPLLTGKYVYADFGTGRFFAIGIDDPAPIPLRLDEGLSRKNPSAISIDAAGEIVFLDYFTGEVLRIVQPALATPSDGMPDKLSDTGCVDPVDSKMPAPGLFPYDVNIPQWMDGATAERWLSIPEQSVVHGGSGGHLALPPGSVAMKTLSAEGLRLETQLLLARPDGTWDAYSYVWSDDQKNATLVAPGTSTSITLPSGRKHVVVKSQECFSCHVLSIDGGASGATIGIEAAQLDRDDVDYGSAQKKRLGNPLATLEKLAMIDAPIRRDAYSPLPREQGFQTASLRARGYLHANCAYCHHGSDATLNANTNIDLRFGTSLRDTQLCGVRGSSPIAAGRFRLAPREPSESELANAMKAATPAQGRMPPVGTILPDAAGIQLVTSWIASIATCD